MVEADGQKIGKMLGYSGILWIVVDLNGGADGDLYGNRMQI